MRPPSPWVSFRTIPKNSRDLIVRGTHVEPSPDTVVSVVLPCRWPRVRRTAAPRPGCPDRLAAHPHSLAVVPRPLASPRPDSGLSWSLVPFSALNLEQRPPTPTQALVRPAGPSRPDSATPSGFLSLLTFSSVPSPSGLVSYRWHSWASAFEGFPSVIAVPTSRAQQAERFTAAGPSSGWLALVANDAPTPVQGFGHSPSPFPRPVLPGAPRAAPHHDLHLLEGCPPRFSTPRFLRRHKAYVSSAESPLMGFCITLPSPSS